MLNARYRPKSFLQKSGIIYSCGQRIFSGRKIQRAANELSKIRVVSITQVHVISALISTNIFILRAKKRPSGKSLSGRAYFAY